MNVYPLQLCSNSVLSMVHVRYRQFCLTPSPFILWDHLRRLFSSGMSREISDIPVIQKNQTLPIRNLSFLCDFDL